MMMLEFFLLSTLLFQEQSLYQSGNSLADKIKGKQSFDDNLRRELINECNINASQKRELCIVLIKMLRSKNSDESLISSRKVALVVLSRNVDYSTNSAAIEIFIDHIDVLFPSEFFNRQPPSTDKLYPAVRGLLMMGERSFSPILSHALKTDKPIVLENIAFWFNKYYGRSIALRLLNDIVDRGALTPEEEKRIRIVIDRIELGGW